MPTNGPDGPFPPDVDPLEYDQIRRRVLWSMPIGLYVLGAAHDNDAHFMTTSLVMQVATSPKLVAASIERDAFTLSLVKASGHFCLSLLAKADRALVRKFVKRQHHDAERRELAGVAYATARVSGAPLVPSALAYLDCRLERDLELGSHHLVIGEVIDAAITGAPGPSDELEVLAMSDTRMSYGG